MTMLESKQLFSWIIYQAKNRGYLHEISWKNVLCEKGDEITRFDGTKQRKVEAMGIQEG